jgi:hypothetical protein
MKLLALLLAAGLRSGVADDTFIQLGAERGEAAAAQKWEDIRARTGTALDGLTPRISAVDIKHKGRLYRLRAGPTDAGSAASICAQLKTQAIDCIVVR